MNIAEFEKYSEETRSPRWVGITGLILSIPSMFLNAWAITVLWGWFLAPFVGFALPFAAALGGAMIIGLMTMPVGLYLMQRKFLQYNFKKMGMLDWLELDALLVMISAPLFALLFGFIMKLIVL